MTLNLHALPSHGPDPTELLWSRNALPAAFAAAGFTRGAEVGVWEGSFAQRLCEANDRLHLTCVDPWRTMDDYAAEAKNDAGRMAAAFETAKQRLSPFGCLLMRMTSIEAAAQIPDGSLDFVYIDGNHLFPHVLADLCAWTPKVRSGGVIAGHDYTERKKTPFIQVKKAVDTYTRDHGIHPWFVLTGDKSPSYFWVVQ